MHPLDISGVNVPGSSNRMSLYNRLAQANLTNSLPIHRLQRKPSMATTVGSISGVPPLSPISVGPGMQSQQAQLAQSSAPPPNPNRPSSPTMHRRLSSAVPPGQQVQYTPILESVDHAVKNHGLQAQALPANLTTDDFTRAVAVATVSALRHQQNQAISPARARVPPGGEHEEAAGGHSHGGHEAPSWSRGVSASVLLACTFLYAIIAGASSWYPHGSVLLMCCLPCCDRDSRRGGGCGSRGLWHSREVPGYYAVRACSQYDRVHECHLLCHQRKYRVEVYRAPRISRLAS
jgi:Ca2+:H+ antiporter